MICTLSRTSKFSYLSCKTLAWSNFRNELCLVENLCRSVNMGFFSCSRVLFTGVQSAAPGRSVVSFEARSHVLPICIYRNWCLGCILKPIVLIFCTKKEQQKWSVVGEVTWQSCWLWKQLPQSCVVAARSQSARALHVSPVAGAGFCCRPSAPRGINCAFCRKKRCSAFLLLCFGEISMFCLFYIDLF